MKDAPIRAGPEQRPGQGLTTGGTDTRPLDLPPACRKQHLGLRRRSSGSLRQQATDVDPGRPQ